MAVVYLLSGALIAAVPLTVFGILIFILFRIYWRTERAKPGPRGGLTTDD